MIGSLLTNQFLLFTAFLFGPRSIAGPTSCFDQPGLHELVGCFDSYTVPEGFYDSSTYAAAQPRGTQRDDWKHLIQDLLVINANCESVSIPSSLQSFYTVRAFQEYCVLYETTSSRGTYSKGWGLVIVPAQQSQITRDLHFSAPHPGFDLGTPQQAAAVFRSIGARSLLIAGRNRTAFIQPSECIRPQTSADHWYLTDPAHNNLEPFFDASIAIHDWQHKTRGCPASTCAFIQFHGKASTTCPDDTVFMSSGLGNSPPSIAWYTDAVDRPIKRLLEALRLTFPLWQISFPANSFCALTATKTVVGRYINNISISEVCDKAADDRIASGEFVHIEQAWVALSVDNYAMWAEAFQNAFGPSFLEYLDTPSQQAKGSIRS